MMISLSAIHTLELAIRCCLRASATLHASYKRLDIAGEQYFLANSVIKTERDLSVLQGTFNGLTDYIASIGIFLMELIAVACNVTCLKIWKSVPIAVMIFLPLSAIVTALAFIILYSTASLYENSVQLEVYYRLRQVLV